MVKGGLTMNDAGARHGALEQLIRTLGALPGLGQRSARRIVLHLLAKRSALMVPLGKMLLQAAEDVQSCHICGNLDAHNPCHICQSTKRDESRICVVAQVSDIWAIERTQSYRGLYHVLGGELSALDGVGPQDLRIDSAVTRSRDPVVKEVILALGATVDGQSTAHYLADRLTREGLVVSRLAHGVPVGGQLDYLDEGTITTALNSRR